MNNTIIIEVSNDKEPSVECIPVGNSGEHNAAILKFVLDSVFTDEYRYYLEFTLPNAKSFRTGYLELNLQDSSILFSVPASLSSESCVDCCFNAVKIDADGKTTQLLKPKSVTLIFSPLYNSNGEILKEYDFSINTLLENIKNGAFKGEKGDKGSEYLLTENDKSDIIRNLTENVFGKIITKKAFSSGSLIVSDASFNNAVSFIVHGQTTITKPNGEAPISKDNIAQIDGVNSLTVTVDGHSVQNTFSAPINCVDSYCDTVNLVSGKITSRICVYEFDGSEQIILGSIFENNGKPFYRCFFAPKKPMLSGSGLPGLCSHFNKTEAYIPTQSKLDALSNTGKIFNGIWFGQANEMVYFFTEKTPNELSAFFAEQKANGTPVKIYYILNVPIESECEKKDILLKDGCNISLLPEGCTFDLEYYADISKVIANIESKIS